LMFLGALISGPALIAPGLTCDFLILEMSALVRKVAEAVFIATWNTYLTGANPVGDRPAAFSLSFVVFAAISGIGSFLP